MTDQKTVTKKKGRPRGAKTADREVVKQVLLVDPCPKCGCRDKPKNPRLVREGDCNVTVAGQHCTHYRHETAKCPNPECGQAFLVKSYTPAQSRK